jgi:hypothetical protein
MVFVHSVIDADSLKCSFKVYSKFFLINYRYYLDQDQVKIPTATVIPGTYGIPIQMISGLHM